MRAFSQNATRNRARVASPIPVPWPVFAEFWIGGVLIYMLRLIPNCTPKRPTGAPQRQLCAKGTSQPSPHVSSLPGRQVRSSASVYTKLALGFYDQGGRGSFHVYTALCASSGTLSLLSTARFPISNEPLPVSVTVNPGAIQQHSASVSYRRSNRDTDQGSMKDPRKNRKIQNLLQR